MAVDVPTQLAIASARIAYFAPEVVRLEKYLWTNLGIYAQGMCTHSVVPDDGNMYPPDFPITTASDQIIGWEPFLSYFPPTMMTAMSITTYRSPSNHAGFIVSFEIRLNGDLYRKQLAYGPLSENETHDWIFVNCESDNWTLMEDE